MSPVAAILEQLLQGRGEEGRFLGSVLARTAMHHGNKSCVFFPQVRTPCGHDAQVIVEGRKETIRWRKEQGQPKQPQTTQSTTHRPSLHHLVVFPLCKVKQVKRKLMAGKGPKFTNENVSATSCTGCATRKVFCSILTWTQPALEHCDTPDL